MYDLSYVVDPAARARLETECFVSDLECVWQAHRTGGESPLGTLMEGTRHQEDKCAFGRDPASQGDGVHRFFTARARAMEFEVDPSNRAKAKRRKACGRGGARSEGRTRYPSDDHEYWRRSRRKVLCS
jgi:hypothetical protein